MEVSMTKKDVLELKKRFKKNECTFTKLCGCYVNAEREIVLNFEETFLNLDEDEFFKYLDIAKKTLSGTVGNNLLELEFPLEEEKVGGKQQFLMGLKESRLKNPGLLETFYQLIIDHYEYAGNYLILLFHDAYDVMKKTSDNAKLDESEEVYEYILCAICPVTLSKPGLGYVEEEHRIGPRHRDWVVEAPDTGFIFPTFTDRSTDIHSIMFFAKNAKEPHKELMEYGFGCPPKSTATEQKTAFQTIIHNAVEDKEQGSRIFMKIQENLNSIVEEQEVFDDTEPVLLTPHSIQEVLQESELPEEITSKIESAFVENFSEEPPVIDHLLDSKVLAISAQRRKEFQLEEKVQQLQEKLEETTKALELSPSTSIEEATSYEIPDQTEITDGYDVVLRVKPEKLEQISTQIIDGKKCIIIPMDEHEQADLNGTTTL